MHKKRLKKEHIAAAGRIFRDVRDDRKHIVAVLLLVVICKLCMALAPRIASGITDYIQQSMMSGRLELSYILQKCILLAVLYFFGCGLDGFVTRGMVRITERLSLYFRDEAAKKLNRLPLSYIDSHPAGDILSRVTNDITIFSSSMSSTLSNLLGQTVLLLGIVIMMIATDVRLAIVYLVILPVGFWAGNVIVKRTKDKFAIQQRLLGTMTTAVTDTYANHFTTLSFGCAEQKRKNFEKINDSFDKAYLSASFYSALLVVVSTLINNLAYIALCLFGGFLMLRGELTIGGFQAFIFYGNMIAGPLSTMANYFNRIENGLSAADRIYQFLDEKEMPEESITEKLESGTVRGNVSFEHVSFGYTPDQELMKDVSFSVNPGQTFAIVGPSGAGKTTLINLLMRFYEIRDGKILLEGKDTKNLGTANLRASFGMVLQDTWIFDGTIADNISYGCSSADRDAVVRAARMASCEGFIEKLPDGYDTHISEENSALSAGEKQLLAIARVVFRNPEILILDEATSQVDTRTEYLITKAMQDLMRGKTCFVIAHRLFTIQNADSIIYMQDGDIKEVGNHEELIKRNGLYAAMFRSGLTASE